MIEIVWSDVAIGLFPLVVGIGLTGVVGWVTGRGRNERPVCGVRALHQPPGWVFGLGWQVLYLLLGIGLMLLWRAVGRQWTPEVVGGVVGVIALQLWWFLFTFQCLPWGAFGYLVGLLVGFAALAWRMAQVSEWAAWMLVPLLMWLGFASFLSFEIATGRVVKDKM
jgi:tryptophan-rich sensory protein